MIKKTIFLFLFLPLCLGFSWEIGENTREFAELSRRARRALEARRWNEALVTLEEAKRKFRRSAKVRLSLAYLYRELGLLQQARDNALWARSRMKRDKDWAERELAWIYWRMMLYEESLKCLSSIHTKDRIPSDAALEVRLRIAKGEYAQAKAILDGMSEKSQQIDFWRGWCLWMMGERDAAKSLLSAASPAAHKIFLQADKNEKDPWLILASWSRQAQEGLSVDVSALAQAASGARGADSSEAAAWEMIRAVTKKSKE